MKYKILHLLLLLSLFSCSYKDRYEKAQKWTWNDFQETQKLEGEILEFDSLIMHPADLHVYDDSLLITINYDCERLFHIFNLNTKRLIGERIGRGQGPKEMLQPRFMENDNKTILLFDMATSHVYEYKIDEFINNDDPEPARKIKLEKNIFINACEIGNRFFGYAYNPDHQIMVFNEKGQNVDEIIDFPESTIDYSNAEKIDAYYMNFISNQKDKIVICYCMTDLIEIYKTDGTLLKRLHGPEGFFSHFREVHNGKLTTSVSVKGKNRDAYFSPENAGKEFFVLYNGNYVDSETHSHLCTRLVSFSWDGDPGKIYELSDGIFTFTIDIKNKKIYGISDSPEYHIVEFDY